MRYIIQIGLIFLFTKSVSQPQIRFDKYSHNYGPVSSQVLVPAFFSFTNTGDEPLAIILIKGSDNLIIRYENRFYQPKETGEMIVFYDNNELGRFSEEIEVFTNVSDDPIKIRIKGRNVDILECRNTKTRDRKHCTIYIIDKESRESIKNARLEISGHNGYNMNASTNRDGKVVLKLNKGNYALNVEADDYITLQKSFYASHAGQVLIYAMDKMPELDKSDPSDEKDIEEKREVQEQEVPTGDGG